MFIPNYYGNLTNLIKTIVNENKDHSFEDNNTDVTCYECCLYLANNNIDDKEQTLFELRNVLEGKIAAVDLWDYCKHILGNTYSDLLQLMYRVAEMEGEDYPFQIDYDDKELPIVMSKIVAENSNHDEITFLDCIDALAHNATYKEFVTPTIVKEIVADIERWQSAHYLWKDVVDSISYADELKLITNIVSALRI